MLVHEQHSIGMFVYIKCVIVFESAIKINLPLVFCHHGALNKKNNNNHQPAVFKTVGGVEMASVAISAVSCDVLLHISVAIIARYLKFNMCNIYKHNISKTFSFFKVNFFYLIQFVLIFVKTLVNEESQKPLSVCSQNVHRFRGLGGRSSVPMKQICQINC